MSRFVIDLDGTAPADRKASRNYYRPYGAARKLFDCRAPEVLLDGPKDTGKTSGCLQYLMWCAIKYPGMRALICRKSRASITQSVQVTLEKKVLPAGSGIELHHGKQEYPLPNESVIVLGGLADRDKGTRVQSSEYDLIYVPEATELSEHELEMLSGLLRNGVMPYQQLLMDCNPGPSSHWLKRRFDRGRTLRLPSRHTDNPSITPERLARLEAMTGVRRKRLYEGLWASAEGMVLDGWDAAIHIVDRFDVPRDWPRYWVVDFGFVNPFVWWAVTRTPDGQLVAYREIYHTRRLVEDHAKTIAQVTLNEPRPEVVICDHDAEDRATLERHLGISTTAAFKSVSPGIEAMQSRLRLRPDGKPGLVFMRDSLVERDDSLENPEEGAPRPVCTVEEVEAYIWNTAKDQPVKRDDHGIDAARYLVAHVDRIHESARGIGVDDELADWRREQYDRKPEMSGVIDMEF